MVYLLPHKRSINYAFLQDEWQLATEWNLTAGLRHDRYSDFGSTTNPRLALVWNAAYNVTLKALHGRAFRSPSFTEQYSTNNPTNRGNPNLKPERIKMTELAPHHHLFLRADWRIASLWNVVGNINYVGGRERQPNDPRTTTVANYLTTDMNLRREKLWEKWERQASVKNLFNRDAREPSIEPGNIAFDLPLAGRAVYLQLASSSKPTTSDFLALGITCTAKRTPPAIWLHQSRLVMSRHKSSRHPAHARQSGAKSGPPGAINQYCRPRAQPGAMVAIWGYLRRSQTGQKGRMG